MRVSREVMAQRHDEIISETSKMLRQRGIVGTSLADLMAAAGLTHGGFYKHFDSKDALVAEATERIFAEINTRFEITFKYRASRYDITVENPQRVSRGIASATLDGKLLPGGPARLPLVDDGATHTVRVILG